MGARVLLPHPHIPGHPFKPPPPLLHSHTGAAPPPGGPTTSTEYIKHKSHRPPSHPVNGRNKEGRHASKQSHWSEREGRWSFCFPVSAVRTLGVAQEPLCSTNTHAPRLPRTIGKRGREEAKKGRGATEVAPSPSWFPLLLRAATEGEHTLEWSCSTQQPTGGAEDENKDL